MLPYAFSLKYKLCVRISLGVKWIFCSFARLIKLIPLLAGSNFFVDDHVMFSKIFLFAFQASCIPCILSGNDVVIAAETGSGKTHGYLVPLMNKLCTIPDNSVNSTAESVLSLPHRLSLVLCPNVMLCEQVVRMANCLSDDNGEPFLRVAAVCGRQVLKF